MTQLTAMDAAFLYTESENQPMQVAGLMILDPAQGEGYSAARFRQVLEERAHLVPAFGRKLREVPLHLDQPYWAPEDQLDLDAHFHRMDCPSPGDDRALGRLVGDIAGQLLDRSRPLFEIWLIEGLTGGRVALVAKVHHSTMYGTASANMMAQLLDLTPEVRSVDGEVAPVHEEAPSTVAVLGHAAWHAAGMPLRIGRGLIGGVGRVGGLVGFAAGSLLGRGEGKLPIRAPRSLINGPLAPGRETAFVGVPFDDVRAVRKAHGTKVNDVVLTLVTDGLRQYLDKRGALPASPLIAGVPQVVAAGANAGTDTLNTLLVPLPVQEADPVAQLHQIAAFSEQSKQLGDLMGPETIAGMAQIVPPPVIIGGRRALRGLKLSKLLPPLMSLIVSNVQGPPIPLWCAGAKLVGLFPFGPLLAGSGLNVTVLSNNGNLDIGLMACPDLVDDVWEIAEAMPQTLARLLADAPRT
ncbi:MAG TPA: wax ester/triacylglycerol synthase family O-acyltransferase [Mycobacteriales bacterium]|nr:wax ester/triacylglycerol synthase family O-acyltransferase [Mycobacteriales bacterium]